MKPMQLVLFIFLDRSRLIFKVVGGYYRGNIPTVFYRSTIWSYLETMQEIWHKTNGCFCKKEARTQKEALPNKMT